MNASMHKQTPRQQAYPVSGDATGAAYPEVGVSADFARVVWADRPGYRIGWAIRCVARQSAARAWRGPVVSGRQAVRTPLSWFETRTRGPLASAFVEALNAALEDDACHAQDEQWHVLMERLLEAYTGGRWRRLQPKSSRGLADDEAPIIVIDERTSSHDPFAGSTRARRESFVRLLRAARGEHPGRVIWIVRSEDAGSGAWLSDMASPCPGDVRIVSGRQTFPSLLPQTQHLYTLGATEGLYALLAGVAVHVFGTPYYAGWGLTDDRLPHPGRRTSPTREALFHAVFVRLARYLDPFTHRPGRLESVIASMELQNDVAKRFGDIRSVAACGFQRWKRPFVSPFLRAGGADIRWINAFIHARPDEWVATWGVRAAHHGAHVTPGLIVEDGFLHSCGLGSDLSAPYSQVIDRSGIYFDPLRPGDLASLLNEAVFDDAELERARKLRERIVAAGLTKYNLGRRRPAWTAPRGAQVVLVAGQVADDASVRLGCTTVRTAQALLAEVRRRRPYAWVVYRPHPDVLAGNRRGFTGSPASSECADVVDTVADIVSLIEAADEVHTLTSLAGFDALLRGKPVFTYGMPFYAGWGLTCDAVSAISARNRSLTLDMLIAGALLRYPLYWDWLLGRFTTPEAVVSQLAAQAQQRGLAMYPNARRRLRKAARWLFNVAVYAAQEGLASFRRPYGRGRHLSGRHLSRQMEE
ncbi:capsular polysaccharide export protein [Paraburkholderia kururiensis]